MTTRSELDLRELLDYIEPGTCDYSQWVGIGMALKEEGYTAADWDEWSRRDAPRYHSGECFKKWGSFSGTGITGGTLVQMAKDNGWRPASGRELDWDSELGGRDDVVIDRSWVEACEVVEPTDWDPAQQLVTYLETLFEAGETVGYVTESWEKDGKYLPTKGNWDRTAGELIAALSKCGGDIGSVLGDYKPEAGAWIRFNPLDGTGCKNENVTEYRYALVESDNMDIEQQHAMIHELELPVACMVFSGGKSLHAIVRIDAGSYDEYRKRVDYLYTVLQKNGMKVDTQNKNPSRLSRMPGAMRNGRKQYIVDSNIGKASWNEWKDWIESVNDDLPDLEDLCTVWDDMPDLAQPLIDGVLRQGHKMLMAGPSKAGKSFALIQLCCSIAEGCRWFGWQCRQGRVLYVNLELDRASCLHRFRDVYAALGWQPAHLSNITIWNLRGHSVPMDKLAPKLIRRAAKHNYLAVIIDPIYKVITGDENSADQMAAFCNQFDRVCTELGTAVIYCHHHSKGYQGSKRSMDRASGSGVFARDPDTLLDLIELEPSESVLKQEENIAVCRLCVDRFKAVVPDWRNKISQDDECSAARMQDACKIYMDDLSHARLNADIEKAKAAVKGRTAWRIEGTLREFPKFDPVNLWFDYPVHRLDGYGTLRDAGTEDAKPTYKKATEARTKSNEEREAEKKERFEVAVATCNGGEPATVKALAEFFSGTDGEPAKDNTIRKWLKRYGYTIDKNTGFVKLSEED